MSDLIIADTRTKQELESEKTALESKVITLQTREGADDFVRERLIMETAYRPHLSASFKPDCEAAIAELKTNPADVVSREITRLEKQVTELSAEIKLVEDKVEVKDGRS